ncbi:uncharacterized protein C17orf67 homolog, partial [Scyliorhinus canicula]|uniref:uncharacterized protein C17orf67 homolog n=1 Tax=Scyliorhinus canicula TaxID=7830 RepID=UPI0018F765EA
TNIFRPSLPLILCLCLTSLTLLTESSPILSETEAKQLLRAKRSDRAAKAGFPDEPMREYLIYLQTLERRSEEQFYEHWLNPHCNRNWVHPV